MSVAKVGASILVLLIVAVQPCQSQCESEDSLDLCTEWYTVLEEALVNDERALNRLDYVFFPISARKPVVFITAYILTFRNQLPEPFEIETTSSGIFENGSYELSESGSHEPFEYKYITELHWMGWSESGLFSIIDLDLAITFQSPLLNMIFYEEGLIKESTVAIYLFVNTSLSREGKEFEYGLKKLTSRVSTCSR